MEKESKMSLRVSGEDMEVLEKAFLRAKKDHGVFQHLDYSWRERRSLGALTMAFAVRGAKQFLAFDVNAGSPVKKKGGK
jgi:hypothetical protein